MSRTDSTLHEHESCECGCSREHDEHAHHHEEQKSSRHGTSGRKITKVYILENLGCAHCASKMEEQIAAIGGIDGATITFATRQLRVTAEDPDQYLPEIRRICTSIESQVRVTPRSDGTSGRKITKVYILENLGCAHCASKMEEQIAAIDGIDSATITFATRQLRVTAEDPDQYLPEIRKICTSIESRVRVTERDAAARRGSAPARQGHAHSEHEHDHEHGGHDHDHDHDDYDHCCNHDHGHDEHDLCCDHDHNHNHDEHDHCCDHDHDHGHDEHDHCCDHDHNHNHDEHDLCCDHDHDHDGHGHRCEHDHDHGEHDHCCEHDHDHDEHDHCCEHDHDHDEHDHCCEHDHNRHDHHNHDEHSVHDHDAHDHHDDAESGERKELFSILAGAVLFIAAVVLDHTGFAEMVYLPVFIIAYLILGGEVLLEAARNIAHGQIFDENFLMSVATIGAFGLRIFGAQEYAEAVGVMLFYRIGEFFEHKAVERSRSQIMDAVDLRPEVVNLIEGGEIQVIPAGSAVTGDLLLIRPGDRIPLDGVVVEGDSRLDTSPITGEPVPVAVKSGDEVTSGCVNTSGQLTIRVERPLEESMVTRILDSVENAAASKPKIDRFITRFSRIYTPCVVLIAAATAILPSLVSGNWNYWIYTALTFLVMSCPCALVLSVPLAFFSGIGAGSKKGILFKGGVSIEALGHLDAVVMDKTGTVTEGNFRLQKVVSAGRYSEEELLRLCAGCEQNSSHPIAHSIVAAAMEKGLPLETPEKLEEISGHGIAATLPEGQVLCGNRKLMERFHISLPEQSEKSCGAEVLLAVDRTFAGYMVISDTVKPDARSAVSRLKSMGLRTVMLTGDSEDSARAVADETGIDDVYAKLLPQDKLDILTKVRGSHGTVMFVGDGINDAPVLAGADVGAAMGSGADAAIEAADAVFMNSGVESIPDAVAIARSTNRIARQNVVFALTIKIAVMILGLLGFANMWMAVFADSGVAMLCVLNSIRVLYRRN